MIDEDGYEVDSEDDDERAQSAIAAAAESDPYADVKIESGYNRFSLKKFTDILTPGLLAPLTAASALPDHPTLSKPFKSKTLTELTRQAREMVQKERASLWSIKHLLTRLSGDNTWIPCESVEEDNDINLIYDDEPEKSRDNLLERLSSKDEVGHLSIGTSQELTMSSGPTVDASTNAVNEISGASTVNPAPEYDTAAEDTLMSDVKPHVVQETVSASTVSGNVSNEDSKPLENERIEADKETDSLQLNIVDGNPDNGISEDVDVVAEDQDDVPAPTRMRTRAQAQAKSDNTATSRTQSATPDSIIEYIHPYFLAPLKSHPDRDLGLPPHEAEETRRLLQLYIQKQEEVCRGAERVYNDLLRANRYRNLVMKWAKAEAHVGVNRDMSDGEDWYDKEEWGLTEDLKKGQDEEEEDAATTAKKTRTRRQ